MEIALNKESKRKTPVIIAYRDGQRFVGEDAITIGLRFPAHSFQYLLDLLGKTLDNPVVKLYQKRFPYYQIEADPERNTVVFKIDDKTKYSVEELIAQILQKARNFAETSTGLCTHTYICYSRITIRLNHNCFLFYRVIKMKNKNRSTGIGVCNHSSRFLWSSRTYRTVTSS